MIEGMRFKDLTQKEREFFHEQKGKYLESMYTEDYIGNREGRTRNEWAHDKAWDDVLCMDEVKEELNN